MSDTKCPKAELHTPAPKGYMAWCDWVEHISKTHRQVECPGCGLFLVWVPKRAAVSGGQRP